MGSITHLLDRLRTGTATEAERAAADLWKRYFPALLRVATAALSPRVQQRVDGEDVALDACQTFFARQQRGEFDLADRDDLWALLAQIARNKAKKAAAKHGAGKRDYRREQPSGADADGELPDWLTGTADRTPTPDEAATMKEAVEEMLGKLPADLRPVTQWRLEGFTHDEIAAKLGVVVRTVERRCEKIREAWDAADAA